MATPVARAVCAVLILSMLPISVAFAAQSGWSEHAEWAERSDDPLAGRAAQFLAEHGPERDAGLAAAMLNENLELALRARREFPWALGVPEELFLNDVLPYASVDEMRERWRPALYAISKQIVKDATTAGEAAQLLNQHLFTTVGVHYNTGRKRANQSVFESMKQGRATCTGLSILLVNACRSVGVPARVVGVAEWVSTPGNHTWVEVWDGTTWRFLGADEHDPEGLGRAWFVGRASEAVAGDEDHAVWATSWRATGTHFPMAWARSDRTVPGVDVTRRYAPDEAESPVTAERVTLFFRVWDTEDGTRVPAVLVGRAEPGSPRARLQTKAGRSDLNDMPELIMPAGTRPVFDLIASDVAGRIAIDAGGEPTGVIDIYLDRVGLTRSQAEAHAAGFAEERAAAIRAERAEEIENSSITLGGHTLRYLSRTFGDEPLTGRSLWISLHGGGGAPAHINDNQWRNQIRLYAPDEGVYVAPRAPTDTWNLWHQGHIDPLFDRLIENMVTTRNVDPDRVYLLGYSAGGDGVYQLAPRTADRYAAAAMMAGHPNEAKPLGLRNLPFAIFMGAEDAAFERNAVAERWGEELMALQEADQAGYPHRVTIYEGLGHWMDGKDAEALPWMRQHTRTAWPDRVVWYQDDVVGHRFYWLAVEPEDAAPGQEVRGRVEGQTIDIETTNGPCAIMLRLHDDLIDLDRPVVVRINGERVFAGRVLRTRAAIEGSLRERLDVPGAGFGVLTLRVP